MTYIHIQRRFVFVETAGMKKGFRCSIRACALTPSLPLVAYCFPSFVDNCDKKRGRERVRTYRRMIAWTKREAGRSNKNYKNEGKREWKRTSAKHARCTQGHTKWAMRWEWDVLSWCNVTSMCTPRCETWCVPDVPSFLTLFFHFRVVMMFSFTTPPEQKGFTFCLLPLFSVMEYEYDEYECVLATSTPCPFYFLFFFSCYSRVDMLFVSPLLCMFVAIDVDVGLTQSSLFFFCLCFLICFSFINILREDEGFWVFYSCFVLVLASCCPSYHVSCLVVCLQKKNTLCSSPTPLFPSSSLSFFFDILGRSSMASV